MKRGYYKVECNNCYFILFWNGFVWDTNDLGDRQLEEFIKKYPVKIRSLFKEV